LGIFRYVVISTIAQSSLHHGILGERDTNQFLLLGSLVIFIVVWVFESIKNHQFQFLNYFRIREPPVPVV
jgi:hypothetical protein